MTFKQIGLELQQHRVGRRAAIHLQRRQRQLRFRLHHLEHVARLIRHRIDRRARDVRHLGVARQADDDAARARIPVRRAEPDERRHEVHAVGVGHLAPSASRRRPTP